MPSKHCRRRSDQHVRRLWRSKLTPNAKLSDYSSLVRLSLYVQVPKCPVHSVLAGPNVSHSRSVLFPFCRNPVLFQSRSVPIPSCASPTVSQSCSVPWSFRSSPVVSQSHCVLIPLFLSPILYQARCVPVPLCPSPLCPSTVLFHYLKMLSHYAYSQGPLHRRERLMHLCVNNVQDWVSNSGFKFCTRESLHALL